MDDASSRGPARHADGRFGPGNTGRPLGSRNRVSKRIALSLLNHYAEHEAEILDRLSRQHFIEYMRLIGRMLPRPPADGQPDLESMPPEDEARVVDAVRAAVERVETGEGTLADVEAALLGLKPGGRGRAVDNRAKSDPLAAMDAALAHVLGQTWGAVDNGAKAAPKVTVRRVRPDAAQGGAPVDNGANTARDAW
jgi:hypothetical protein